MNSSIYLFGDFGQGVISYPTDYAQTIFEKFIAESKAPTQLIIHRDGEIMNYGYIRKIENNHLFGLCIQINGQYISTIKRLFEIFEDVTANIAVRGELIRLNEQGNLVESVTRFANKSNEVERITDYCRNELSKLENLCKKLPSVDYSTSNNDKSYFKEDENAVRIITTSLKNGYTFVYKKEDFDTLALAGYRSTLSNLNSKYNQAAMKIQELNSELSSLKKQKKQMGIVVCLTILLFVGSIIFFNTLEMKDRSIEEQAETIELQNTENKTLSSEKNKLSDDNLYLNARISELTRMYNEKADSCMILERMYNKLSDDYSELQITNSNNVEQTEKLRDLNKQLERQYEDYKKHAEIRIKAKDEAIKDYNFLMTEYNKLKNKYYQTKEGKRELKRK